MRGTIVFAGSLAQKPHQAGHTWVFLQYLLGFKRLGWDVLFLDRLEADMCRDPDGALCPAESSVNLTYLRDVMNAFGLGQAFSAVCDESRTCIGLSRAQVLARVKEAATVINVMGFFADPEILGGARQHVFFDIDPGFGQMWRELGLHDGYGGYDRYVTIGENIGRPECTVPDCGLAWITTRQPVVLDYWPQADPAPAGRFTSIGSWRGPYGPVEYRGRTYGLRAHEFRKFVALPRLTGEAFEIALQIHAAETRDLDLLGQNGWHLTDPRSAAHDPAAYQAYIGASKAEFLVAKNMYVQSRSGWFSDRSICYLASGKPVLAQDTGLRHLYPSDSGLVIFSTLEEAADGAARISSGYSVHCRAAREVAEQYFDSDKVLSRLLDALQVA